MANGKQMIDDLEFEKDIESFTREGQFLARQIYEIRKRCPACKYPSKKQYIVYGTGAGGGVLIVYEVARVLAGLLGG